MPCTGNLHKGAVCQWHAYRLTLSSIDAVHSPATTSNTGRVDPGPTVVAGCPSGPEQHLDRAPLVHGAVALGDLRHGQFQVEHLAGVDLPVPYEVDQRGQVAVHRGWTAVEVNVGEEQSLAVQLDLVRNADVGDVPTLASGADRLQHRFLRPNALKHRASTDSIGHVHDPGDALVAALSHDVGRAECAGELLPRGVPAHRDDPLCTHLPGREHAEET